MFHSALPIFVAATAAFALPSQDSAPEPIDLATHYTSGLALRTSLELEQSSERTAMSMVRDGVEVDTSGRLGGPSTLMRTGSIRDVFGAVEEGRPTAVERTFEVLEGSSMRSRRGEEQVTDSTSPFEGVTLRIEQGEDGVVVEVEDGDEPEHDGALEGHGIALAVDRLLPSEPVELGESWSVEGGELMHALGLDLERTLFPPEPRDGGQGGGQGGDRTGGQGGGWAGLYLDADWDVELTLADEPVEWEGLTCYAIEIEAEGTGEAPERGFGGGGRPPRALEPGLLGASPVGAVTALAPRSFATPAPATTIAAGEVVLQLEGTLYFATELKRPVGLVVEATTTTTSESSRTSQNGMTIETSSTTEGTLELELRFSDAPDEDAE